MTCVICLEAIHDNSYEIPECKHLFHTNCIISWFRHGYKSCPLCLDCGTPSNLIPKSMPSNEKFNLLGLK